MCFIFSILKYLFNYNTTVFIICFILFFIFYMYYAKKVFGETNLGFTDFPKKYR